MDNMKDTKRKMTFKKIQKFSNDWVSYKERKDGKYIKYGDNNEFPDYLIKLYNQSSIHAACVTAIVEGIIGGGLTSDNEEALARANKKGETWNDIFNKVSMDFYLYGSYALEIIWSLDRTRIAEVYHIDFSHLRAAEKDHRNNIPGYYISSEWKGFKKVKDEDVHYLPVYNPSTAEEEPSQIFVLREYRPGQEYYPLPNYNGALKVIELDTEIDLFHVSNIKNGLAPSLAITTFTNGSPDDVDAIEQALRANYGGSENAGSLVYMDVDSPENAPVITPINQNGADDYYNAVNDISLQKILTAHRITSPMMLGIKTEGQLGGRDEVIDAFLLFNNTVIVPLQQDVLRGLESLLAVNYPDIVIGVENRQLYEDGEVEEEIVTSVEVSEEEEQQLNEESND
jgi:hypothetical protein